MTRLLVHGNPETDFVWSVLVESLEKRGVDDAICLSPPGFGAPTPPDWDASQVSYRDWLIAEIERVGEPVDLVGHDWGAAHVLGVVAERPDLVRSWATDCVGLVHPDYEWHDAAQAWQTAEVGEQMIEAMLALSIEDRAAAFADLGVPQAVSKSLVAGLDAEMGRCILALYRSATQPAMAELGERLVAGKRRPGLSIIPTADPYVGDPSAVSAYARRLDADVVTLEGAGHWWMFGHADEVADALIEHWARL